MATLSPPIAFTPTYADGAVTGTFTCMMQNNVQPQAGDVIQTVEIQNTPQQGDSNGGIGTLHVQVFQRNTDGSQGASVFGPSTIKVHGTPIGPVDVSADNFQMIAVTGGPKGTVVEPPFIVQSSWTSA